MSDSTGSTPPRLGVAMIVRDAEALLETTLRSVADIADEIVVADTGSTDRTRQIAAALGARVFELRWNNDFAMARNACFVECRAEWVLWLDAGERLLPATADRLRDFVKHQADPQVAYMLHVRRHAARGAIADQQISQLRLIPNRAELFFEGCVREQIGASCIAAGLRLEAFDATVERPASDHDAAVQTRKAQRNLKLAAKEIDAHGMDARLLLTCAEALMQLGEQVEARRYYQETRRRAAGPDEVLEAYYGEIASYGSNGDQRDAQLDLCVAALETFPVDVQLLCAMGSHLQAEDRIDLAARTFQTAIECGRVNHAVWHLADIDDIAVVSRAVSLQLLDRDDEAETTLHEALEQRPDSVRLRYHLIELLVRRGRRDEALAQCGKLPESSQEKDLLAGTVRGACLAAEQNWVAAQAYLETAYDAGCRDAMCLRWYVLARAELGDVAGGLRLLDEWQKIEPDNDEIDVIRKRLKQLSPATAEPISTTVETRSGSKLLRIHGPSPGVHTTPPPPNTAPTKPAAGARKSKMTEDR